MGTAGKKGGEAFLREARAAFDRRLAELKNLLAKGLINHAEFKKQADLAARTFNSSILAGMEKARAAGKLTDTEYLKLSRTLKRVGEDGVGAWDRIKAAIVRAGTALVVAFGIRGGIRFAFASIQEFLSSEKDWKLLEGTINAAGVSFAGLEKRVRGAAQAFQEVTVHSDEDYARSLQRLIAITGDVEGSIRNMTLVADVAARFFGGDLAAATDAVAKGMNTGVVTINRMKFTLDDLAKRSAKGAVEATQTLAGKIQQLNNQWGEFKEAIGEVLTGGQGAISVLDSLTASVKAMVKWVSDNKLELQRWASEGIATAIAGMRTLLGLVRTFLQMQGKLSLTAGSEAFTPGKTKEAIEAQQKAIEAQRKQLEQERIAAQKAVDEFENPSALETARRVFNPIGTVKRANAVELELRAVNNQLEKLDDNAVIAQNALDDLTKPTGGGGGGGRGGIGNAGDRAKELERVEREIAVKTLMIQRGLTEEVAKEEVRREEIRRPAVERTKASLAELEAAWKRLGEVTQTIANKDLMVAAGLDETLVPALSHTESRVEQLKSSLESLEGIGFATPANAFETEWTSALRTIEDEARGHGDLFRDLGEAWAEGGLAGLAVLAGRKVKENLARAIEEGAKALGSLFFNPPEAAAHAAAAVKHGVAAAAWRAVAGGGGGSSGGASSTGGVGSSAPNLARSENMQKPAPEWHLHFKGSSFYLPEVQKQIYDSQLEARQKFGPNVKVIVHRGP